MDFNKIRKELVKYPSHKVDLFIGYLDKASREKKRDKTLKNPFMGFSGFEGKAILMFKKAASLGFFIDGKMVNILSRGLSFDYHCYISHFESKHPEGQLYYGVVRKEDKFEYTDMDGDIVYSYIPSTAHVFNKKANPIIGAFCVIKTNQGQSMTIIDKDDINQIKSKAMTAYIWKEWEEGMTLKSVIRRGLDKSFKAEFAVLTIHDNKHYDIQQKKKDKRESVKTNTKRYANVVKAIANGSHTIEKVKEYYDVTPDTEKQIIVDAKKLKEKNDK